MTEWRRAMRSWPKETPQTADPASLPEWVVEAGRERSEAPETKRTRRHANLVIGFMFLWALAVALLSGPWSWGLLAGGAAFALVSAPLIHRAQARARGRRRDAAQERAALVGEPALGAEYVGVDYAEDCWLYPGLEESADEGFLRLDMDRLVFSGGGTRFELPADAILGTELRRCEVALGARPRLVVHWACGGESGTVGVGLPPDGSLRRRVQDAIDLRDRIERWRSEPFPRLAAPAVLPPTMSPWAKPSPLVTVGLPAKTVSALFLFASLVVFFALAELVFFRMGYREFARHLGGSVGVLMVPGMALWLALAAKIEPHLPERWRSRVSEAVPAMGLGEARNEVERSASVETTNVRR